MLDVSSPTLTPLQVSVALLVGERKLTVGKFTDRYFGNLWTFPEGCQNTILRETLENKGHVPKVAIIPPIYVIFATFGW